MEVIIKNFSACATLDTKGAELKSLQDCFGTEYMWQRDPAFWNETSPVLFPIVGRLRDGKTLIDGVEYEIPCHGFAKGKEFRLIYHADDKAIFSLMSDAGTLSQYPFRFNLQISYTLTHCDLEVRYDVFNLDDKELPFCLGTHPGFRVPLMEDEAFEDYSVFLEKEETIDGPVYEAEKTELNMSRIVRRFDHSKQMKLHHDLFAEDAIYLRGLESRKVSLISSRTGRGVEVSFSGFSSVAFWTTAEPAPFVCIEPWCGSPMSSEEDNQFLNKYDMQILQPDEKKTFTMKISML